MTRRLRLNLIPDSRNGNKGESQEVKDYNNRYRVPVYRRKKKSNESNKSNEVTTKWLSLPESEQNRFAQSYMTFIDYMAIHKKVKRRKR